MITRVGGPTVAGPGTGGSLGDETATVAIGVLAGLLTTSLVGFGATDSGTGGDDSGDGDRPDDGSPGDAPPEDQGPSSEEAIADIAETGGPSETPVPSGQEVLDHLNDLLGQAEDTIERGGQYGDAGADIMGALRAIEDQIRTTGAYDRDTLGALDGLQQRLDDLSDQMSADTREEAERFLDREDAARAARDQRELDDEQQQRALREAMDRQADMVRNLEDQLPVSQWGRIDALVDRLSEPTGPNLTDDDLQRMQQLTTAMFRTTQAAAEMEGVAAQRDADLAAFAERAARNIQIGAAVAGVAGGGFAWAGAIEAGASGAVIGVTNLGSNFVTGAVDGYVEGGWRGAAVGAARATLPINTAITFVQAFSEDKSLSEIGLAVVQDFGNAVGLRDGVEGFSQLARATEEIPSGAIRTLAGEAQPGPPTTAADAEYLAGQAKGKQLVGEFEDLHTQKMNAEAAGNEPLAQDLGRRMDAKAAEINGNYQAKARMKELYRDGTEYGQSTTKAFSESVNNTYKDVDRQVVQEMNDAGYRRWTRNPETGNLEPRELTPEDIGNMRNAKSAGSPGMDRDAALNEKEVDRLTKELAGAEPESLHAQILSEELLKAKREAQISVVRAFDTTDISRGDFTEAAQAAYERQYAATYKGLTGVDDPQAAQKAFQQVTSHEHPEAYADLAVLKNNPVDVPFSPDHAAQTASVTQYKAMENEHLFHERILNQGDAFQETGRGVAKDMDSKLLPLLQSDPNVDPGKLARMESVRTFMDEVGRGKYLPSQVDQMAQQRFGRGFHQLVGDMTGNLQTGIQFRQPAVAPADLTSQLGSVASGTTKVEQAATDYPDQSGGE